MITHAQVRGGAPSGAKGMADHLMSGKTAPVRRDMVPEFAILMGVRPDQPVDRRQAAALLAGRRADGKLIPGKRYVRQRTIVKGERTKSLDPIGAYDFCFTPDKSVSVAWAFARPHERTAIMAAHRDAAEEVMEEIEVRVGRARVGAGGKGGHIPGHIMWMTFDHFTSRPVLQDGKLTPGDPDIHSHYSVPNVVWTESGRIGALDTIRLKGFFHEARCLYHQGLTHGLEALGAAVERVGSFGAATLTSIPDIVRAAFSRRTVQGDLRAREMAAERGLDWDQLPPLEQARWRKAGTQRRIDTGDKALDAALKRDGAIDLAAWHKDASRVGWMPQTPFTKAVKRIRRIGRELPLDPFHALLVKTEALRREAASALQRGEFRRTRAPAPCRLAARLQDHRERAALKGLALLWEGMVQRQVGPVGRMEVAVRETVPAMAEARLERGGYEPGVDR